MGLISTRSELLRAAVADLYLGKALLVRRLPYIGRKLADARLQSQVTAEIAAARDAMARLEGTGIGLGGPRNLWMAGILADAERDTRTTAAGVLRDVAVIGALRKAKAAEIVSGDTAVMLADGGTLAALMANQEADVAGDAALKALLEAISPRPA